MTATAERPLDTQNSRFQFPPTLSAKHVGELEKRSISKDFALASCVRTAADNELRALNFQASLAADQRGKGLQGLCFTYRDIRTGEEVAWRIKPDTPFMMGDGRQAKYLSRIGDRVRAYFPHTSTADMFENTKVNAVITEGEFKALAIAEALGKAATKPFLTLGLQGVNGGWHREKHVVPTADGGKERRSFGPASLIDDLEAVSWHKRTVYIVFDSDVGSRMQASEFKRSKYSGAWGAEYILAGLLRAQGAEVRIVLIPDLASGESKTGADDYIARHGPFEFLKLLWNS